MHPAQFGPAPALVAPAEDPRGTVLLMHGLGGDALVNAKELAMLAGAGFHAIGLDAPMHGRRFDPTRDHQWEHHRDATLARLVHTASSEIPEVLDAIQDAGFEGPYAAIGISLGGFSLWQALPHEPRLSVVIPVLASPALPGRPIPFDPSVLNGRAILALSAEHDESVDNQPTADLLGPLSSETVKHTTLAGSGHCVPETQWWGCWGEILAWLGKHSDSLIPRH